MSRVRRLVVVLRELALWVGAALGTLCVLAVLASALFQVRPVVFQSGSMSPTIETGALGFASETPASELRVGDVVIVPTDSGASVAHRLKAIEDLGEQARVRLQGDANPAPDPEPYVIDSAEVILFDVPTVGRLVSLAGSPAGLLLLGAYAALLLSVVLRRRSGPPGGGGGGSNRRARPRARRRRVDRVETRGRRVAAAGATILMISATPVWAGPWTDDVSVSPVLAAHTVTKPASVECDRSGFLFYTITISWAISTSPFPLAYSARVMDNNRVLTVQGSGTRRYVEITEGLLSSIVGGTATIEITAYLPGTVPRWTSVSAKHDVTTGLLGLSFDCSGGPY